MKERRKLPALDNAKRLNSPDLNDVANKNYTDTILRYGSLATHFPQLDTNAKTVVAAINELYHTKSTVIPNPPGEEPTDTLNTVKIDGTVFNIEGGGGGGGGISGYKTRHFVGTNAQPISQGWDEDDVNTTITTSTGTYDAIEFPLLVTEPFSFKNNTDVNIDSELNFGISIPWIYTSNTAGISTSFLFGYELRYYLVDENNTEVRIADYAPQEFYDSYSMPLFTNYFTYWGSEENALACDFYRVSDDNHYEDINVTYDGDTNYNTTIVEDLQYSQQYYDAYEVPIITCESAMIESYPVCPTITINADMVWTLTDTSHSSPLNYIYEIRVYMKPSGYDGAYQLVDMANIQERFEWNPQSTQTSEIVHINKTFNRQLFLDNASFPEPDSYDIEVRIAVGANISQGDNNRSVLLHIPEHSAIFHLEWGAAKDETAPGYESHGGNYNLTISRDFNKLIPSGSGSPTPYIIPNKQYRLKATMAMTAEYSYSATATQVSFRANKATTIVEGYEEIKNGGSGGATYTPGNGIYFTDDQGNVDPEGTVVNADAGRFSSTHTVYNFDAGWKSGAAEWTKTGETIEGNDVYQSNSGTYGTTSGTSVCSIRLTGYSRITIYLKQDSTDTSKAYLLLGKLDSTIDPSDSNTYEASYKNITTSDYVSYTYELVDHNDLYNKTIQIMYYKATGAPSDSRAYIYIVKGEPQLSTTGEIFNDYSSNAAIASYSHAEGYSTFAAGWASHTEGYGTVASGSKNHAEGHETKAIGPEASHAEGYSTIASGTGAPHAEGYQTQAIGQNAHSEGRGTVASGGISSHAEGYQTTASGDNSHAEGHDTTASGWRAHSEGYGTLASGTSSHSEGEYTTASGVCTHAEGDHTTASGSRAHSEGYYTTANDQDAHAEGVYTTSAGRAQHVFGRYNVIDDNPYTSDTYRKYVEIVGNGTDTNARSNARTLDWDGNEVIAGKITVGTGPINNMDVATKQYVDDHSGGGLPSIRQGQGTAAERFNQDDNNICSAYGDYSHVEGYQTEVRTRYAHAEGNASIAQGESAHAEGANTWVAGTGGHAEGGSTRAGGNYSHAEGYDTQAQGAYAHAQNLGTFVYNSANTAIGKYNVYAGLDMALIVGNGTDDSHRSNAFTLDWSGNAVFAGDITLGTPLSTTAQTVAAAINELYASSGGSTITVTQKVSTGTNIADITVDGTTTQLFAPTSGGSNVVVTPVQLTGNHIADIQVDGVTSELYSPTYTPTEVVVTQVQSSGTQIASISVDGVTTELYAPNGGSAIIDDSDIALDKTWSSYKINEMFFELAQRVSAIEKYLWGQPVLTEDGDNRVTEDGDERLLEENE